MVDKVMPSIEGAIAGVKDGAVVMIGGFGQAGTPFNLVQALVKQGARGLTVISNSISQAAPLVENRRVRKLIASFPIWVDRTRPNPLDEQVPAGEIELVTVPQGTLAEAIRAGGAGIAAFYTPIGVGTFVEEGKEKKLFDGKECLLELSLKADVALVKAYKGDRMGNLVYHMTARNFNPLMAMAATLTVAEVEEIVDVGELDPETIVTPGIFVDRVVKAPRRGEWMYHRQKAEQ
jgi:3-oxoadipate CoA-transferase alpha subunit